MKLLVDVNLADIKLVENLKWRSIEKDNMEFECPYATCYQVDALRRIIRSLKNA